MLGSVFKALDSEAKPGDGVLLKDLQGAFVDEDNLQIASVDGDGNVVFANYYYWTEEYGYDQAGWYDGGDVYVGDSLRIPVGSAFWFLSADGAKSITASGEVLNSSFEHTFSQSIEMVCSAFPVGFNPNAVDWVGVADEDNIQVASVDKDDQVNFTNYYYWTEEYGYDQAGWYDGGDVYIENAITAPGQGFWLLLGNPTGVTMTEYSPLNPKGE